MPNKTEYFIKPETFLFMFHGTSRKNEMNITLIECNIFQKTSLYFIFWMEVFGRSSHTGFSVRFQRKNLSLF